jgi:hypothetical protein
MLKRMADFIVPDLETASHVLRHILLPGV